LINVLSSVSKRYFKIQELLLWFNWILL